MGQAYGKINNFRATGHEPRRGVCQLLPCLTRCYTTAATVTSSLPLLVHHMPGSEGLAGATAVPGPRHAHGPTHARDCRASGAALCRRRLRNGQPPRPRRMCVYAHFSIRFLALATVKLPLCTAAKIKRSRTYTRLFTRR